ncbi:protein Shroom3-like isoform X4 [Littorina saxatilis]
MVSAKSSPNLVKAEASVGLVPGVTTEGVKPVKSSSDIPDDVGREKAGYRKRPSMYEHQMLNKPPAGQNYGGVRYSFDQELRSGGDRRSEKAKRYSEDMYTSDMRTVSESQVLTPHSLQKYQPDYENVSMLGTAPLQSEKISEIDDLEDGDSDAPVVPPRPACVSDSKNPYSPTPPQRDPSSLKYIKVNQNHEKYPSWPVTQSSAASNPSQPINTRAQSWTDHTNTSTEFPTKQRLAYQPGLRPLPEKNSPTAERKGEESSSKAPRNSSDPGLKTPEFVCDRNGKVIQKKKDDMKGRFEDFYQNSKPGYLPPRFDSDGHSYGDKEYSAPSPPERDVAGVDHQVLSQALGTDAGEQQQPQHSHQQRQSQQPQPQEPPKASSYTPPSSMSSLRSQPQGGSVHTSVPASVTHSAKRPGYLPTSAPSQGARNLRQHDMATSPLASPRDSLPSPRDAGGPARSKPSSVHRDMPPPSKRDMPAPSHREYMHRESPGGRQSHKPFIVKQTPYYNTSTQTDVQSYAVKMSDPRAQQVNVETQVGDLSSPAKVKVEQQEKSIQARMSREFQPAELSPTSPTSASATDKRNYFRYTFDGRQSIRDKYDTDEDAALAPQPADVFTPYPPGDQASIMRKLSEEFYGGNKLGLMSDKRHSSASSHEHSPKPMDSSLSVYSGGTMSQAESYSSVIIHASESAGPFGRDDFGSSSSIGDSPHEVSSIESSSRSSLRDNAARGRNSLDYFPRSAPRPLQESKKFNSLSAISHQRELSAPKLSRFSTQSQETLQPHSQEALSVDTRWRHSSGSQRDSSSASEASSPSQPKTSPDARTAGSYTESACAPGQSGPRAALTASRHPRMESADSVFSEPSTASQRDRGGAAKSTFDGAAGRGGGRGAVVEKVGRKPSMKKAYGTYDESERSLSPTKDNKSPFPAGESRTRGSYSDAKQLDQIQEEGDSGSGNREQRSGELVRHPTQGNIADPRHPIDSWKSDLEKRTGRTHRTSEQVSSSRDRSIKTYENTTRPQRLFDGSIDSGVGSEISSRVDGQITPSEPSQSSVSMDKASGAELKKFQQQAVLNFVQRKTGRLSCSSVDHSPESSMYESIGTPRSPHSPTSESVNDLISKTNENLAKRADSIRRSGSTSSSRASSSEYVDMNRQDRSRKETEWSRLRSSGSFHYNSNRSSLCSENTYEDISVFADPMPRGSTQEVAKIAEEHNRDSMCLSEDETEEGKMESGMMASPNYQNFPGASQRRPPPPPPRTPSPEPRTPPALPPRNYLQPDREDEEGPGEEGAPEDAKIDFKSLFHQWESNSPREDAYAAQLRKQAMKINSQRGSTSSATAPTSMSVIHSRTAMGISTSFKRQPMVPQEATTPTGSASGSVSVTSSVSSVPSLGAGASAAHRNSGSDISSAADSQGSMSPTSHTKEVQHAAAAYVDRDTKPVLVTVSPPAGTRPPQLPERMAPPSREDKRPPPRADNLPPRDRSGSEMQKDSQRPYLATRNVSRDRSSSDSRVLDSSPQPPSRDNSRSPAGSHRELPLPSPPKSDHQETMAADHGDLPPPPPELLGDPSGSYDKGGQLGDKTFADDSYGAFKNRGNRQVGTYKRSSSAALLRPDNHHLAAATEANSVFSDRKLGNHNWNSDSQLQHREGQVAGGSTNGLGGPPGRPPDRQGNVPAFKADSGPVRVTKVQGGPQPLASSPQGQSPGGRAGGDVTFSARPYQVEPPRGAGEEENRNGTSTSPKQQPRSVKDRIDNLERKTSFSSSSSSSTPTPTTSPQHTASAPPSTSSSQRWADAAPFEATHRAGGDTHKAQPGNSNTSNHSNHSSRVPNSRPMVQTDSHHHTRERPPIGSPASEFSTQSSRPRAHSERSRQGELPPPSDSRSSQRYTEMAPSQRYPEVSPSQRYTDVAPSQRYTDVTPSQRYSDVAPVASDPRALPGHVRNSSQNSTDRPRSSSSPYNRRESAPAPQIPPDTAVINSPRRKSEGNFLSSNPDGDKDASPPPGEMTISHGRQPSQEELECDQRAAELAREVADSEKKLSDVLSSDTDKKRMKYMDGLFSADLEVKTPASVRRHQSQGSADLTAVMAHSHTPHAHSGSGSGSLQPADDKSSKRNSLPKEYFVSPPKAVLEMEWRRKDETATDLTRNIHDNDALIRQKEELIEKLYKKLDLLKEERTGLQEEIQDNDALGRRVCESVDHKCQSHSERDKFHAYIDDLEKIVRLLLNLSGQLARAENAVQSLTDTADPKIKKMTLDKRERLQVKHAEAKQLKEDIDKRSDNVSAFLRKSLSNEELQDYAYFVKMKSKLTIELQELEDKITLGQEQIQELKKSIPEPTAPPSVAESVSSAASSPRSSPVAFTS